MTAAGPRAYEVMVQGHLDDHWSDRLGGLALLRQGDGTTLLTGHVADQAALHGVLCALRDIGAVLLAVSALDIDAAEPPTAAG